MTRAFLLILSFAVSALTVQEAKAPAPNLPMTRILGVASWYGASYDGKKTANGERFDRRLMTAAHRTIPFGAIVQVTNLRNRKSICLRINDRGPYSTWKGKRYFIGPREIDVSEAAATVLGFRHRGLAPVEINFYEH